MGDQRQGESMKNKGQIGRDEGGEKRIFSNMGVGGNVLCLWKCTREEGM